MRFRGPLAAALLFALWGGCGGDDAPTPPAAPPAGGAGSGAGEPGGGAAGGQGGQGAGAGAPGGSGGDGGGTGGAGGEAPEAWPAPALTYWVNPNRCYPDCAVPPLELVQIDARGEPLAGACTCPPEPPPDDTCPDSDCCPSIARAAQPAFTALLRALEAAGQPAGISSAFRDYAKPKCLFNEFIDQKGRAARPGHSEHELGLAADVDTSAAGFAWLAAHVHEFGFALSFPEGKQKLTGFRPEPWHVRYVGSRIALAIYAGGLTPEEYFRQHPGETTSAGCSVCPDLALSTPACGAATNAGDCLPGTSVLSFCYEDGVAQDDPQYLSEVDCAVTGARCVVEAEGARCTGPSE